MARLRRLASFANPVFFKTQALRFSTHGIPRFISCARIAQGCLPIPRGCLDEALDLMSENQIEVGVIGGGKLKLNGVIDIATYQSHFLVAFFSLKLLLISPRSKLHITLSLCSDHWFFWSILINGPISINERPHSALFN